MRRRIRIYPYKQGSKSACFLAEGLKGRVLKLEGSSFNPREGDVIINWGSSKCPFNYKLNGEIAIQRAANKLESFKCLQEALVPIPDFATSPDTVSWEGMTVVRHKLTGHSGEGIELCLPGTELPKAPLYVQYIPKKDEYRVHVIGQSIIAVQRKARNRDVEAPNWQVRNHANGFVFVRNEVNPPELVLDVSRRAITALGLDFGAVDVIWNEKKGGAYVLEVNTAPGLEGQTITDYVEGFRSFLERSEDVSETSNRP